MVYTVFTLTMRAYVCPSVTFCFLNILKSHLLEFHQTLQTYSYIIYKTNTLNKWANSLRVISLCNSIRVYAMIVHTRTDQLLQQLFMEQFDTLPSQCRHIEHIHEVILFKKKIDEMTAYENFDNFP